MTRPALVSTAPDSPIQLLLRRERITREQEIALSARARKGDTEAQWDLALGNAKFAYSQALKYAGRGVEVEDLFSDALRAMMEVAARFDASLGGFIAFAKLKIRSRLEKRLADFSRQYRVPRRVDRLARFTRQAMPGWAEAEPQDLAEQLQCTQRTARSILRLLPSPVELDAPLSMEAGASCTENVVADPAGVNPVASVERDEQREELRALLSALKPRERTVIEARFGLRHDEPQSLELVSRTLNVSRERVRQIEFKALRKLRLETSRREARRRIAAPTARLAA